MSLVLGKYIRIADPYNFFTQTFMSATQNPKSFSFLKLKCK